MVRNLCSLVVFFIFFSVVAQVTNEGTPASWDMTEKKSVIESIKLPALNIQQLQAEDKVNDNIRAKPWRFGYKHEVNYSLDNSGVWTDLANGDRIWRILFESQGA